MTMATSAAPARRPFYRQLYVQVLAAIVLGAIIGHAFPEAGKALKLLGDLFIKLVKMVIAPVIFLTIATGISGSRELGAVGRIVGKALAYFLTVSSLALLIGLVVGNIVQPGAGMNIDPATLDAGAVADYAEKAHDTTISGFVLAIVPETLTSALTSGSILQSLFAGILFGTGLSLAGEPAAPVRDLMERVSAVVFRIVDFQMTLAPVGVFGAIAFTVGQYGAAALLRLGELIATFYATAFLFVAVVLGAIARLHGFSLLRLLVYLKSELLLVLGTSSSEAALPALIEKLEDAGCDPAVAGLVVPAGYSFNLDGTNIYMTLAALFIAQALGIDLTLNQQIGLMAVAMLSSKGAAGVTGAGFITLAATLQMVPTIPVAGMALILGGDRFMSACRSLTNFIGNAVASLVVARWEGKLDRQVLSVALHGNSSASRELP